MEGLSTFSSRELAVVNESVAQAEELVCNHYKMSANQWKRLNYDIKTLADLADNEIVYGPFAQIVRYTGVPKEKIPSASIYDFYKICFQDHSIQNALIVYPELKLYPFSLYIITHELIHVVRFCKFLQNFEASPSERLEEEIRVHRRTREILGTVQVKGLEGVLDFYRRFPPVMIH